MTDVQNAVNAYNTAAGTASGADNSFTLTGSMLTFQGDGTTEPSLSIMVTAIDDTLIEGSEDYTVTISNAGFNTTVETDTNKNDTKKANVVISKPKS